MADDTLSLPSDDTPIAYVRPWGVLAVVVAGQFMFVMDTFLMNLAVPAIRDGLWLAPGTATAALAAGQLAYASLVVMGGGLGDFLGRRGIFVGGVATFAASSVWCAFAASGLELILARLLLGAGSALMVPQVLATIQGLCPPLDRARAFAVFGTALGLGAAAGFLLGGWLLDADPLGAGWRGVFLVNPPLGVAIAIAALALMPAAARDLPTRLDLPGAALLSLALAGLIGPVLAGPPLGWPRWLTAVMALGASTMVVAVMAGRATERRGGTPFLHPALLRDRAFRRGLAAAAGFQSANIAFYFMMSLYLQDGLALSPLASGALLVPPALAFTFAALMAGRWAVGGSAMLVLMRGTALQGLGLFVVGVLVLACARPALPALVLAMTVFGFGQGLVMAPLSGVVLSTVRQHLAGVGAGLLTTVQQAAGAFGISVVAAVNDVGGLGILPALGALGASVALTAGLLQRMRRAK
jgi:MFS family permease